MADYGYFGKGAEGYAHYSQTFKSTFPSSSSSGSHVSYHSTVHSSQSTRVDTEEKMDTEPQNSADQSDVVINLLFSLGMLGLHWWFGQWFILCCRKDVSQIDTLVRGLQMVSPAAWNRSVPPWPFGFFRKRRSVYAQNGKNNPTDCVTDSMTEAVFYSYFCVVYGRFWVDFTQKWGDFGCFSGKQGARRRGNITSPQQIHWIFHARTMLNNYQNKNVK